MDIAVFVVAVIGLTLAGIVKGATGLGYASCALPSLVMLVGLKPAMAIVLIPAMATNISVSLMAGHAKEILLRFNWLYLSILPGVAIGVYLLQWVDQALAVKLLGVVITTYVVLALSRPNIVLSPALQRSLQLPTGLVNGVLTGLTGAQVMPLFPYVMSLNLEPDRTVQVVNITVLISTAILGVGLITTGDLTSQLLVASLAATVPAIIGTYIGNRLRAHIPAARFKSIVLLTLSVVAFIMIVR